MEDIIPNMPIKKNRRKEDGTYDNKPLDPHYFRDYYRNKLSCKGTCEICGKEIVKVRIGRHQQTMKCRMLVLNKIVAELDQK